MRSLLILLILASALLGCANAKETPDEYTLYLVRHAEKETVDSKDPALTSAGQLRAEELAARLRNKDIEDVWSSDYKRTRDTAAPLAAELDIEVKIYNPEEPETLITALHQLQRNALIVGHSNTIPELARLLCQCPVADMEETEYDRLLVISVQNGTASLESLIQ
jgi:broad specificity phosphatase PhoE